MIALLGFVLECAAVAALLGAAASLLALFAAAIARPLARSAGPSLRADLAFIGSVLPAIAALAGTTAVAMPPIASALGLAPDHCLDHGHHLHVCLIHGSNVQPALAALGAAAIALWSMRGSFLLWQLRQASRDTSQLERLGRTTPGRFPLVEVPGAARLCHAVGSIRRRVLVSAQLAEALAPAELRCALAHESAHLERRDPLANLVMSCAGLLALPRSTELLARAYRRAAEQACDDSAARAVADGALVAQALVRVASLQRGAASAGVAGFGFGQHPLELRVQRLLSATTFQERHALALPLAAALAAGALALAVQHASFLHHAVETALHVLF